MTVVAPFDELLVMVRLPVAAPADAGSNCTSKVDVWPGVKVTGSAAAPSVNPVPVAAAEAIVTGAVPVDAKVTDWVDAVFCSTLPNATLVALTLSVGTAGFNCRANVVDALPLLAVRVTVRVLPTEDTVAVNTTLIAFAGTNKSAGTDTAALLLDRLRKRTFCAAAFSTTTHKSVPEPEKDELVHESAVGTGGAAV
jgi:hypothetical protein